MLIGVGAFVGLLIVLFGREMRKSTHDVGYVSPYSDEALLGALAEVGTTLDPAGEVLVSGETWEAELVAGGVAEVGERVRVAERREHCLLVERENEGVTPAQRPRRPDSGARPVPRRTAN